MASPATTETTSGRNSGVTTRKAASTPNSPFEVIPPKIDPPPVFRPLALTAMPISTGTSASITSRTWLRRRPSTSRSSERKNLAGDIEALPGEPDELFLQAGPDDGEAAHPDPRGDEGVDHLLGH